MTKIIFIIGIELSVTKNFVEQFVRFTSGKLDIAE